MSTNNGTSEKMKVSKKSRKDGPPLFNHQKERMKLLEEIDPGGHHDSLYDKVEALAEGRIFNFSSLEPNKQLKKLAKEIKVRVKISQREIFIIGELLWKAKAVCQRTENSWMEWVENNCDFSYPQAKNYMNVYRYCFSMVSLALEVPISILYKVSQPKFPDELRVYLFEQGGLVEMTNGELKEVKEKYDNGGIEAVEPDIEEFNKANRIRAQIRHTFDQFENALRILSQVKNNMEKGRDGFRKDFDKEIEDHDANAQSIQKRLWDAVSKSYDIMNKAKRETLEPKGEF